MDHSKWKYSIQYKTKVVGITSVNLVGVLDTDVLHLVNNSYDGDKNPAVYDIAEYLEKFDGKRVRILIEELGGGPDEEHLLPDVGKEKSSG